MEGPVPPPAALAAIDALIRRDPRFAAVLDRAGPLRWHRRTAGFPGLLQALTAQMISNAAAAAIWGRLRALPGALEPAGLLALPEETLRAAGLSRPKALHARALAGAFLDGTLSAERLALLGDEAAILAIAGVKGMGRWSAEIYLLFALGRADVFPAGDVALAASAADLLDLPCRPSPAALRRIAQDWAPARALAARLLWHHWRHVKGRPTMDDFSPL